MNFFHPHDMILKAQKAKYKILAFPAIVIIICFIFSTQGVSNNVIKYISAIALLFWLFILVMFRYKRFYPTHDISEIVAPINGKIISKKCIPNGCILTIQKNFFSSSEIVTCSDNDIPNKIQIEKQQVSWEIHGNFINIFIDDSIKYQSVLIGLAVGYAVCEVFIPMKFKIQLEENEYVSAGESIIAKLENLTVNEQEIYE
ncbi:MAG: hypothetical protein PHY08_04385 [Candidatus Cloacimonetes bacterium]|nr:hypothetical protein [Candidatus Cloacimonadota bacterium]MDD4155792.1 hypothetical protein [Candidatus Cloacimonadota bacterium]